MLNNPEPLEEGGGGGEEGRGDNQTNGGGGGGEMALTREVLEPEVYNEDELFDESSEEEGGRGDDQEVNKHL